MKKNSNASHGMCQNLNSLMLGTAKCRVQSFSRIISHFIKNSNFYKIFEGKKDWPKIDPTG